MNNKNKHSDPNCELYRAVLTLRTPEECHAFFHDLCTQSELNAIEQRYEVAKMLHSGMIYNDILAVTKASSATISRVNRSLVGGKDSYVMVFGRLKEQEEKTEE
ncbi:MAG: hypothetical protein IJ357_01835 [Oscillospiraceae bacterium]|nr:hypothetical protein [Oscillospiraceae bacterium]